MPAFRDFVTALRELDLDPSRPVIAHASLSAFGEVLGGADTILGALLSTFSTLLMPVFTYRTMLIPETGPQDNGIVYGSGKERNRMAEFFQPDMPADRLMGKVPETLRRYSKARRSSHPILSFTGVNAGQALDSQTIAEPLAPIRVFTESGGWVLLLGVDHTVNTSIHYAEYLAERKQFVRWALTPQGVQECPGFPGCSDGFQALEPLLESVTRQVQAGPARIQAVPLAELVQSARNRIASDPMALLCDHSYCERCQAVRSHIAITHQQ